MTEQEQSNNGKNGGTPQGHMARALALAQAAAARGEIPVGAVLVHGPSGDIIAEAGNLTEERFDATAHAEMLVLQAGGRKLASPRLAECDLYVTLEPCPMCAAAIGFARVRRLYFGAYDPKGGGVEHGPRIYQQPTCHHKPEVYGGIDEQEAARLLKDFFKDKR
ncbi:MAG: nucleoside deaminase [Micavibrio sp.]|nr:nucleoside deaminase [Micavibrio sp.]